MIKKRNTVILDVEDLGTNLYIDEVKFGIAGEFGIAAFAKVRFSDDLKQTINTELSENIFIDADFDAPKTDPYYDAALVSPRFRLWDIDGYNHYCVERRKDDNNANIVNEIVIKEITITYELARVLESYFITVMYEKLGIKTGFGLPNDITSEEKKKMARRNTVVWFFYRFYELEFEPEEMLKICKEIERWLTNM